MYFIHSNDYFSLPLLLTTLRVPLNRHYHYLGYGRTWTLKPPLRALQIASTSLVIIVGRRCFRGCCRRKDHVTF